jgi:hypothetical protein
MMNISRRMSLIGVLVALGSWGLLLTVAHAAEFDVAAAIGSAATKADHERIAAYYTQQADELDAKIAQHVQMSKAYRHAGTGKHGGIPMDGHCDKLIETYRSAAAANRELAKAHQGMGG